MSFFRKFNDDSSVLSLAPDAVAGTKSLAAAIGEALYEGFSRRVFGRNR